MAVVGTKTFTAERHARVVRATLGAEGILSEELRGEARATALKDFLAGADWLRGTNVDQLSSREAAIIAVRLVKRLQTKAAVSEQVAHSLTAAITEFFEERFLRERIQPKQVDDSGKELVNIATAYLDERSIRAFANALEEGYRPAESES